MRTAGRTVLFSGLTVAAAMSSLLVFPQAFLKSMGYGGIAAVLVAMLSALTVLPAALRLLGRRIDRGRVLRRGRSAGRRPTTAPGPGSPPRVMRRPVLVLVAVTVGLLVLASPFLGVKWGSIDHRILPPDSDAYVASEMLSTEFGAETATRLPAPRRHRPRPTSRRTPVRSRPSRASRRSQPAAAEDGVTLLRATWEGSSQSRGVAGPGRRRSARSNRRAARPWSAG